MFMDAYGIRPAMFELADKLATAGYCVALPDLYYRIGWTAKDAENLFEIPEKREFWTKSVLPTISAEKVMSDMPAWISALHARSDVPRAIQPLCAKSPTIHAQAATLRRGRQRC